MDTIFQIIKKAEKHLIHGVPIKIGKYATHDHTEKIATIDAYLNSQHISGLKDSLGREKPFFNIVLLAAYTWFKMTDIDRKNILFRPRNTKQRLKALVATIKLRIWMDRENFGQWLNEWGWKLACYGSVVSKFVEKDGKLVPSVISWDRMICDPVDFQAGIRGEKLYFTPAQLRQQPYDPEAIEDVITRFNETRTSIDGQKIDVKGEFIGVYEVHGNLPLSYLTDREEDDDKYQQQMHVVFIEQTLKDKRNVEITLYSGKETKDPYYLSHLIEQEGRVLSIGAVESVFDPQWMINDSMKKAKDQLDLSSKMAQQTSDPDFLGRNLVTEFDTGSVLITKENQPLVPVNFGTGNLEQVLGFADTWKQGARDVGGVHEAVTGEQPPSGTPYRLQAMLSQQASGLFKIMGQNKGLHLEEMLRTYVIPFFQKKLKDSEEIIAVLDGEEIEQFDELSLPARMETELMTRLSLDHIPSEQELMSVIEEQNMDMGNVRIMKPSKNEAKTWKEYFSDLDMEAIEVEITGENRDKASIITTLDTLLQRMLSAPQMFSPKDVRKVFNKILDEFGDILNPLQLSDAPLQEAAGGQPVGTGQPDPMAAGRVGALGQEQLTT